MKQLTLFLPIPRRTTYDNFIIGPENEHAVDWLRRWPEWPLPSVVIHGESRCGKTHLGKAFAAQTKGVYVKGDGGALPSPDLLFSPLPTSLILDDYDQIIQEDWLFHVYNLAKEHNVLTVYLGRTAPAHHSFGLADLRSRLRSVHSIGIDSLSETLFKQLLKEKLLHRGLGFSPEMSEYLFRRLERSYAALDQLIERADLFCLEQQRLLTVPVLREILGDQVWEEEENEEGVLFG